MKNKILIVVAHGESWEVAASRAVSDLVKKIIEEQNNDKEQPQENGTFALTLYTCKCRRESQLQFHYQLQTHYVIINLIII